MELFIPNRSDIMHQIFGYLVSKQNVYTNYLTIWSRFAYYQQVWNIYRVNKKCTVSLANQLRAVADVFHPFFKDSSALLNNWVVNFTKGKSF